MSVVEGDQVSASPKADNLPLPPMPEERFGVLSLDPPWHFRSRAASANPESDRSAQKHYPTMDLKYLATLPIRELAKPDAHVFMWITGPLMTLGVHNMLFKAWGVRPSSMAFVWIKLWNNFDTDSLLRSPLLEQDVAMGGGFTTRQNAEYVVLGRIGSPSRDRADIRQVILSARREHSRKPEEYYRRVEHYTKAGPRLDMFAGAERPGWTPYGWSHREGERTETAAQRTGKRARCNTCEAIAPVNDYGVCTPCMEAAAA